MIRVTNLTKEYLLKNGEQLRVLENVSLTLPSEKSIAIVGQSGSGKSTLLSLLAGLDTPSKGNVEIFGSNLGSMTENQLSQFRSQNIGIVFQNFQLLKHFSALSNVTLAAELAGIPNPVNSAKKELDQVGLAGRYKHLPTHLSGGECQRVAIARAVVAQPKLLLCDEPTGSLDTHTAKQILDVLWAQKKIHKTTLVIVTHDTTIAQQCEIVVQVHQGKIVQIQENSKNAVEV
jgi:putative ABC transport system ATP-binding protein